MIKPPAPEGARGLVLPVSEPLAILRNMCVIHILLDAAVAQTSVIASSVFDQAERIRLASWAEMPSFNVVE